MSNELHALRKKPGQLGERGVTAHRPTEDLWHNFTRRTSRTRETASENLREQTT